MAAEHSASYYYYITHILFFPWFCIAFMYKVVLSHANPKPAPHGSFPNGVLSSKFSIASNPPFLSALKELRDIVKSHIGSDSSEKSEPLLSTVLGRFDSILGLGGSDDNTTEAAKRQKTTDWGLLLEDTVDFVEAHKGLIQDGTSQALRINEDIRVLIDVAHSQVAKEGVNDKAYVMERVIQLASSLPDGSETQTKLTRTLIKTLWDSLLHPPLSYLGDENQYRTADGSNNSILFPNLGKAGTPYARSVPPVKLVRPHPDPGEVFDKLLARRGPPKEHPNKVSSMLFYLATIIIHGLTISAVVSRQLQTWGCTYQYIDLFRSGDDTKDSPNPNFSISSTSSYLDLGPLYGNNEEQQQSVRTFKDGMLKPDTFWEFRILGFPPGVSAFLVLFNRFHNYVAAELKRINEGGRFTPNSRLKEDAAKKVDHDLFNTARLITCGLYVNIILSDYVKTILNMNYAPDSTWVLDPRVSSQKSDNGYFPVATGNQVSAEFNLVYRWHSTISAKDEKWSEDFFQKLFPGQDISKLSLTDFFRVQRKWKDNIISQKPETRTFADLKRNSSGAFNTKDLSRLIVEGTQDVSAAYGARQVPMVLKLVEMLGISQARGWHVGTLNELRNFMGLTPHKSFEDINPDPEIQKAMKALYKEPDLVEMYPGLVFEDAKEPFYPGSGLCAGFTITRAVLSDAVTLVRGDRFYTTDWTPATMTSWGFDLIQSNKRQDKLARGGKMHHLLDVGLPELYTENSVWKMFPFTVPDEIKRIFEKQGVAGNYDFSSPL